MFGNPKEYADGTVSWGTVVWSCRPTSAWTVGQALDSSWPQSWPALWWLQVELQSHWKPKIYGKGLRKEYRLFSEQASVCREEVVGTNGPLCALIVSPGPFFPLLSPFSELTELSPKLGLFGIFNIRTPDRSMSTVGLLNGHECRCSVEFLSTTH